MTISQIGLGVLGIFFAFLKYPLPAVLLGMLFAGSFAITMPPAIKQLEDKVQALWAKDEGRVLAITFISLGLLSAFLDNRAFCMIALIGALVAMFIKTPKESE